MTYVSGTKNAFPRTVVRQQAVLSYDECARNKGEVIEMLQHAKPVTLATVATVIFVLFSLGSALFFEAYTTHLLVYLLVSGAVFFLIMLGAFKWLQNR